MQMLPCVGSFNRKPLMLDPIPISDPLNLLREGAAALGLELSGHTLEQFRIYLEQLQLWNARINLTALKTQRDIIIKHFLDSLAGLPFLGDPASLADLGSGAGFPGLVLKLVRPEMTLTLMEARRKKAAFLDYLASHLGLAGVEALQVHLTPALARKWGPRFAAVVSRAAFSLDKFLGLAAPLLLPGGKALALKGPGVSPEELAAASGLIERLGLKGPHLHPYNLPISGEPRLLVLASAPAAPL